MFAESALHKRLLKEFDFTAIGKSKVKIPNIECALAMKFAAMTGHYWDQARQFQDVADFLSMVAKNKKFEMTLLHELGELHFVGAGAKLTNYVEDARAGRRLKI